MSVDVGAILDGWHGDGARTFIVGDVPGARQSELVDATRLAMMAGIAAARSGPAVGDISAAIEDVGLAGGYGIVRPFVGHGIGTEMHQDPQVPNYRTGSRGVELQPGICLAIEPMFTLGGRRGVRGARTAGRVATQDDALAAHFEHTIADHRDGPLILTRSERTTAGAWQTPRSTRWATPTPPPLRRSAAPLPRSPGPNSTSDEVLQAVVEEAAAAVPGGLRQHRGS